MENLARAHTSKVDEAVLPTDNNINWASFQFQCTWFVPMAPWISKTNQKLLAKLYIQIQYIETT